MKQWFAYLCLCIGGWAWAQGSGPLEVTGRKDNNNHFELTLTGGGLAKPFIYTSPDNIEDMVGNKVVGPLAWIVYMEGQASARVRVFNVSCPKGPKIVFDGRSAGEVEDPDENESSKSITVTTVRGTSDNPLLCRATVTFDSCQTIKPTCKKP